MALLEILQPPHPTLRARALPVESFDAALGQLVADPSALKLGGERREVTLFFSDLVGFTALSEKLLRKYYRDSEHPYSLFEDCVGKLLSPDSVLLDAGCGRTVPVLRKFQGRAARLIGVELVDFTVTKILDAGAEPILAHAL